MLPRIHAHVEKHIIVEDGRNKCNLPNHVRFNVTEHESLPIEGIVVIDGTTPSNEDEIEVHFSLYHYEYNETSRCRNAIYEFVTR